LFVGSIIDFTIDLLGCYFLMWYSRIVTKLKSLQATVVFAEVFKHMWWDGGTW